MKKRIIIVVAFILVIAIVCFACYLVSVKSYQDKVKNIKITEVDLSTLVDGEYIGECNVDYVYAKVAVTIKNNMIEKVTILEHKNGHGSPAEVIVDTIVDEQKIDVDVVSGATNSSKVLKKAVENALQK